MKIRDVEPGMSVLVINFRLCCIDKSVHAHLEKYIGKIFTVLQVREYFKEDSYLSSIVLLSASGEEITVPAEIIMPILPCQQRGELTPEEFAVMDKFTEAWNLLMALPKIHPSDDLELCTHYHGIQKTIMARAAVRAHPDYFYHLPDEN